MSPVEAPTMVITMAGFGSRFQRAGYHQPKYKIEADGQTLFERSLASLDRFVAQGWAFIFVVRADDGSSEFIKTRARAAGVHALEVMELDRPTDGQATTARLAVDRACGAQPFAIFNIDTAVTPGTLTPPGVSIDGWIPCFRALGDHWSFVRLGPDGGAVEVREKRRISEFATLGLYWFSSASLYARTYDQFYRIEAHKEAGEKYVAPLYNHLIAAGRRVEMQEVALDQVSLLGTPAELEAFLARSRRASS